MIMDGYGLSDRHEGNAVFMARKPNIDKYWNEYPHTTLNASGMAVGLPDGQMGNSEVGHTNIGAGRIVYQELTRITKSIKDGDFFENPVLNEAFDNAVKNNSAVHLMGLVSDGGVHSHIDHIRALIRFGAQKGLKKLYLHAFMDGRDTSPTAGAGYIADLLKTMEEYECGKIASISGRYYAMDRDNRWDRVEKAYNVLVYGNGEKFTDPVAYLEKSYRDSVTDEFIIPAASTDEMGNAVGKIKDNDSVIFFNFRPDRGREMTRALFIEGFSAFERKEMNLHYVTMTEYDRTFEKVKVAYRPQEITNTIGEVVAGSGGKQLRIAETEKYAHVTFFLNGGKEVSFEGEDRILVPSPKVATYDLQPEMSAFEVTDKLLEAMDKEDYSMIILNFANCDMVGHTGVIPAAVKAVETVDTCMGKIAEKVLEKGGTVFVTADHGNAEQEVDFETGKPFTSHTTNPVPLIYITASPDKKLREGGILSDLAPTILEEMGLEIPEEMTSKSLLV